MLKLIKNLLGHKKIAVSVSVLYTILLLLICLINLEGLPEKAVQEGDKILHFLAYFILTLLWYNVVSKYSDWSFFAVILIVVTCSILFGIIIELLQSKITSSRTADFNDIIANSFGVLIAALLLKFIGTTEVKKM